ncbi:hypothetical protein G6F46_004310 [Rhizopus delemar]|nr:hypothetical protein G6F46_004310 [Rhizopus delemar]KAG1640791.1 hypothetical protein G6F44_006472 [Rhizopus delemar]
MKYVQVSKALYDYDARTEDEITVKENDILYVIEKEDDDWWKAQLKQASGEEGGPIGLVPAQYLEEVTPIGRVRAEYDYQAQQEEELSFEEGDEMDLLERDDPDWYLVKHSHGQVGLAPSNYVQLSEQYEIQQEEEEEHEEQPHAMPVAPPVNLTTPTSIPSPVVQPVLSHSTGPTREMITDDAQSWTVHEYDPVKKKKKKGKGNLFIGNGMLCYGSETDKASPVQQYPILDVKKYLFDSKNLHIEVEGDRQAILDFQASSKSEAKAILVKISDSIRAAQTTATQVSPQQQVAAPAAAIAPSAEVPEAVEELKCEPKWGISIYDFHAEGGDELSVAENEQVYVLDYVTDDGWWRVQKVNGEVGLVPSSYVEFDRQEEDEGAAPRVDNSVEEIRRQREQEERELQQRRIAEEQEREERKRREEERRREEEERVRREQEENRRREEERRRQEAAAAAAAKRAEAARLEEERRKSAALSRSLSTSSSKSTRQQDLPKPDLSKIRTWTDRTGAFRVEAQFVDFHNGKLRLHKLNGVKIDVPAEKMSPADLDWVNQHLHKTPSATEDIAPPMPTRPAEKKRNENWDWFDWFMTIGIPHQASLQYASAFKADKLDDSDIPKLTHKQMKTLGLKEEHVQRVERFIETGQSEDPEEAIKEKQQSQIEKDEELARRLQREFDEANKNKKSSSTPAGRPRPSVSAPKDVHPDLLEFIGNQLTTNDKGKEPEKPKNDLVGFTDDAWAPRSGSSPIPTLTPLKPTPATTSTPPPPPPAAPPVAPVAPIPTGPSPEELRAQEAERKRIAEEEQIQKIKLMNLQRQAEEQQRQLEELQKLTKQQLELQKQLAMQTGTQQQQQQQQQQMQQIQLQQQQLQHQLAQQPAQLQPSLAQQPTQLLSAGRPRPVPNHRLSSDPSLGQWQAGHKPTGFQANQPTGFQATHQPTGFQAQAQPTGFQAQAQPTGFQAQQQPFQTGFQQTGFSSSQPAAWQNQPLQPQMTGFPPSTGYNSQPSSVPVNSVLPPPLVPTAAGQSSYNSGIQRSHTIAAQPTGRHWNNATPDNPFGSPTLSPLQAQMTGVQFSTPSPNAFNHSPLQSSTGHMQPQMTGVQPPATHSIFTPQGSMQYGQSAFPGDRRW